MINSAKIPRAYSEVYSFLNVLGNYYINKIPDAIYDTIKKIEIKVTLLYMIKMKI